MSMLPPRASPQATKYPVPVQAIDGCKEAPAALVSRMAGITGQAVGGGAGPPWFPAPALPPAPVLPLVLAAPLVPPVSRESPAFPPQVIAARAPAMASVARGAPARRGAGGCAAGAPSRGVWDPVRVPFPDRFRAFIPGKVYPGSRV